MAIRFDLLTERAQEALMCAREILVRYGHKQIDVEHLLLALLEQSQGIFPRIVEDLEVDAGAIRAQLEGVLSANSGVDVDGSSGGQLLMTPHLKQVFVQAHLEAGDLRDEYVSTEHLLLAIADERETAINRLLHENGITRQRIDDAIQAIRDGKRVTNRTGEA
jgi:ATP-dependent Clp protease ATP-binding subunit ClpB